MVISNNKQNTYDFVIIGNGSVLDSLASVNFFTRLEKNISQNFKKEIDIINNIFSIKKDKITIKDLIIFLKDNI